MTTQSGARIYRRAPRQAPPIKKRNYGIRLSWERVHTSRGTDYLGGNWVIQRMNYTAWIVRDSATDEVLFRSISIAECKQWCRDRWATASDGAR